MEGLFGSLASGLRRRELKTTDAGNLSWAALFGQQNSRSGVSVNVDSALKVSTVFACLRVLADGIAQVPLKVYREKADGSKELAKDHPAYRLLSRRPNEWMKESWAQYQGGLQNRFKTAVLDMDSTWTPLGMKGVDAEHLDTRRFQIEEICRDLKVFPQMVGYADKTATFASAEAFFLAHVIHTLNPWIENWEQSLARDLFPDEDDIVAKFSMQGLLRGDNAARATFYASGITNGWLTRNEARRLEDLNPIEGLGEPLLPLNMSTQAERAAPLPPGGN